MHALPLAYITDIPSHITCATPAQVDASPDAQNKEAASTEKRLIVRNLSNVVYQENLSTLPHQICNSNPFLHVLTSAVTVLARLPARALQKRKNFVC
jgi:hypothetical protein